MSREAVAEIHRVLTMTFSLAASRLAWGASPRIALGKRSKPAQWAAAELFRRILRGTVITRFAGSIEILLLDLGLTPQALC